MYYLRMKYLMQYFQSLLARGVSKCIKVNKPMFTNRQKVLHAIIRSPGIVVNVLKYGKKYQKNHDTNSQRFVLFSIFHQGVVLLNY